jgi:hypothetical protein
VVPAVSPEMDSLSDLFPCKNQGSLGAKPLLRSDYHSYVDIPPTDLGVSGNPVVDSMDFIEEVSSRPESVVGRAGIMFAPGSPDLDYCMGQATRDPFEPLLSETEVALHSSVQALRRKEGLRELDRGECSLSSVLDSLVPALQELPEPKALITYKGKEIIASVTSELPPHLLEYRRLCSFYH